MRRLSESIGVSVGWNNNTPSVTLKSNVHKLIFPISRTTVMEDDKPIELNSPVILVNGTAMVRLDTLRLLDENCIWDKKKLALYLTGGQQ